MELNRASTNIEKLRGLTGRNKMRNTALSTQKLIDLPDALQSGPPPALSVQARKSFQEGITQLQSGEAEQAVAALSQCVEYAPDFVDAHVFLGMAHALTYNI